MTEEELAELREELAELREWMIDVGAQIAGLDKVLAPYWVEKAEVEARGKRTHVWIDGEQARRRDWRKGHGKDVVVGWLAGDRAWLYAELDRLAGIYGRAKSERKELAKAYRNVAKRVENIGKLMQPKRRRMAA